MSKANAIKYLCRYGKKDGRNRKDLLKGVHYVILLMNSEMTNALKAKISKQEQYQIVLGKHIKWMRSLGLNVDDDGDIIKSRNISNNEGYYPTTDLSDIQLLTKIIK